jgi:hypothetical protein
MKAPMKQYNIWKEGRGILLTANSNEASTDRE